MVDGCGKGSGGNFSVSFVTIYLSEPKWQPKMDRTEFFAKSVFGWDIVLFHLPYLLTYLSYSSGFIWQKHNKWFTLKSTSNKNADEYLPQTVIVIQSVRLEKRSTEKHVTIPTNCSPSASLILIKLQIFDIYNTFLLNTQVAQEHPSLDVPSTLGF